MYPPPGAAFGPETIAVLTAAYDKAIDGQPAWAHATIAKHIIALASEGERDPGVLRQRALALLMRDARSVG